MTSVGYGDLCPRTVLGRIVNALLIIWGSFIISMMVVALTNLLNLDKAESRALLLLRRLEAKKVLKGAAAYLITRFSKKHLANKKLKSKKKLIDSIEENGNYDQ
jgi:hypothetical protein